MALLWITLTVFGLFMARFFFMDEVKILTIDMSIWRCGSNGEEGISTLGSGRTLLLNECNQYCCLGMFSKQLNNCITDNHLYKNGNPGVLKAHIPLLNYPDTIIKNRFYNTDFSHKAMSINDDWQTTIQEKKELLTKLCADHGYKLIFINEK